MIAAAAFLLFSGGAMAAAPFDFDGDNRTDLSIFRPSNGQWWILKSGNSENNVFQFGIATDRLTPADYTGDGKWDIAVWRSTNGSWYILRSEDYTYYAFVFGQNGDKPYADDFDGDDKADQAIFRPTNGTWYINRSTGGTTIQPFGISTDAPIPADYDGDGIADISVYRWADDNCWVLRSTGGLQVIKIPDSRTGEKPVVGDFSGDGISDCAIYNFGGWVHVRSQDGLPSGFFWNADTGILAPGDYDGNGRTDAAYYTPTTGTWHIRLSATQNYFYPYGLSGDKPAPSSYLP